MNCGCSPVLKGWFMANKDLAHQEISYSPLKFWWIFPLIKTSLLRVSEPWDDQRNAWQTSSGPCVDELVLGTFGLAPLWTWKLLDDRWMVEELGWSQRHQWSNLLLGIWQCFFILLGIPCISSLHFSHFALKPVFLPLYLSKCSQMGSWYLGIVNNLIPSLMWRQCNVIVWLVLQHRDKLTEGAIYPGCMMQTVLP